LCSFWSGSKGLGWNGVKGKSFVRFLIYGWGCLHALVDSNESKLDVHKLLKVSQL
jgi:hypothetical protein